MTDNFEIKTCVFIIAVTLSSMPCFAEDKAYLRQLEVEADKLTLDNEQPNSNNEQDLIQQINTSMDLKKQREQWYLQQISREVKNDSKTVIILEHTPSEKPITRQTPRSHINKTTLSGTEKIRTPKLSLTDFEAIIINKKPTVYHFYNTLNTPQKKAIILEYELSNNIGLISKLILDLYSDTVKNRVER